MTFSLTLADAYIHRLDPFLIQFTDGFGLRWYGMSYVIGLVIGWLFLRWMARTNRSPLSVTQAGDLMFAIVIGVLLGGRLGYVLLYQPELFIEIIRDDQGAIRFPYWGVLAINKGGMASHGGMIGVALACWWYGRRHRLSSRHLFDMAAIGCSPGLSIGRLANLINGELWGRALPMSMRDPAPWWSIKYPAQITERWSRAVAEPDTLAHSTLARWAEDDGIAAADMSTEQLRQTIVKHAQDKLDALAPLGDVVDASNGFYTHIVQAAYTGQQQVIDHISPMLTPYYPSQFLQALTDGPLLFGPLLLLWWKPRKPGVIGGWFLLIYGALRIASERFRQPDEGVELLLGLSRGQFLSVLMVLAGIALLVAARRSKADPMGGLVRKGNSILQATV